MAFFSLKEYLHKNKPQFVQLAEKRRQSMLDTQARREETEELKKLSIYHDINVDRIESSKSNRK